mgnify:CR=1 FL=1
MIYGIANVHRKFDVDNELKASYDCDTFSREIFNLALLSFIYLFQKIIAVLSSQTMYNYFNK